MSPAYAGIDERQKRFHERRCQRKTLYRGDRCRRHLYRYRRCRPRRDLHHGQGPVDAAGLRWRRARFHRRRGAADGPERRGAVRPDLPLHARLDRGRQHAADPQRRADRADYDRRLRGHGLRHPRRLRPLGRPAGGLDQASGGERPAGAADFGRCGVRCARARRLQGRGAAAARRGRDRTGGAPPGRRPEGRGDRHRVPLVLLQCRERTEGARHRPAGRARSLCHPVERYRAGAGRIRAQLDGGHQRLCRPHCQQLSDRPEGAARRPRLWRAGHGHAGLWRAAAVPGSRRPRRRHDRVRPGRRRDRRQGAGRPDGRRRRDRRRHGRHDLQGRRHPERRDRICPRADGRPVSLCRAQDRGGVDRRRRRQHRLARPAYEHSACRPAQRRRRSGPRSATAAAARR